MEGGVCGVLRGLGADMKVGCSGKYILRGASSLGGSGRLFNQIYLCFILFSVIFIPLFCSDIASIILHDLSHVYTWQGVRFMPTSTIYTWRLGDA